MRLVELGEIDTLLTMANCLQVLEQAYRDLHEHKAVNVARQGIITPRSEGRVHSLNTQSAGYPRESVVAVRINSDILHWPLIGGQHRRVKIPAAPGGNYVGLILLFSADNGELLSIMPDGGIQAMRVGATGGLSIQRLAKESATKMALLGAGWQARAAARAACAVRRLTQIRVYSPNPMSRTTFAAEMSSDLGVKVVPVEDAEQACKGADIVSCATNSIGTVFHADRVEPGQHILCIRKNEIDPALYARADRVVIHDKQLKPQGHLIGEAGKYAELREPYNKLDITAYPELSELIAGKIPGRKSDSEVTIFCNNRGTGLQIAAVAKHVLDLATERGKGHELPAKWFVQSVHS